MESKKALKALLAISRKKNFDVLIVSEVMETEKLDLIKFLSDTEQKRIMEILMLLSQQH